MKRLDSEEAKDRLTKEYDRRKEQRDKPGLGLHQIYWGLGICMYICAALVAIVRHDIQGTVVLIILGVIFCMLGKYLENTKK